ncbi:MAG: hypothetical protein QOK47_859 [Actinomycetota bacterium]|jgi:hypothetical protein|nr:hypothetical protein [Actinomycetota bacterium]
MILAHSFTPGGPDIEFLVLAFALFALAIVMFFQKTAKRSVPFVLLVVAIALTAGAFTVGGSTPTVSGAGISVKITSPAEGATVPADKTITLDVALTGGTLVSGASTDPKAGHFHVYVDRELVSMPTNATPTVKLEPGSHVVSVEFTTAAHASYSPRILDEVTVEAK